MIQKEIGYNGSTQVKVRQKPSNIQAADGFHNLLFAGKTLEVSWFIGFSPLICTNQLYMTRLIILKKALEFYFLGIRDIFHSL